MSAPRRHSDLALYRRLLLEARPFWRHIAGLFALSLLSAPLMLLNPLPLKIAVDSVLGSHALPPWFTWLVPANAPRSDWKVMALVAGMVIAIALTKQLLDLSFAVLRIASG